MLNSNSSLFHQVSILEYGEVYTNYAQHDAKRSWDLHSISDDPPKKYFRPGTVGPLCLKCAIARSSSKTRPRRRADESGQTRSTSRRRKPADDLRRAMWCSGPAETRYLWVGDGVKYWVKYYGNSQWVKLAVPAGSGVFLGGFRGCSPVQKVYQVL